MKDPFEPLLDNLSERMTQAWKTHEDLACPLGEFAAEIAALLQFYREQSARVSPQGKSQAEATESIHWSHTWRRDDPDL